MKKSIFEVLKYFSFFEYPSTIEEIYTFLPKKTTKKELKKELDRFVNEKIIKEFKLKIESSSRYTIGEYSKKLKIRNEKLKIIKTKLYFNDFKKRYSESEKKLKNWRFRLYIKLISFFPQIKLVGLSGSLAMMNAQEDDDIDLFIITAKNRLFTGRFIAVVLAWILGIKRTRDSARPIFIIRESHLDVRWCPLESEKIVYTSSLKYKNKICLNLFFDESDLEVPDFKKNEYIAHEVLQMKPIVNKDNTYHRFLKANKWVFKLFPNAVWLLNSRSSKIKNSKLQIKIKNFRFFIFIFRFIFRILSFITEKIEKIMKMLQIYFINRHRTTEIITNTQLWFHPEDFQRKIKK